MFIKFADEISSNSNARVCNHTAEDILGEKQMNYVVNIINDQDIKMI